MSAPRDPVELARELGVPPDAIEPRLTGVCKVDAERVTKPRKGRVVLVTAMTPTPAGEGKTTTSIGLVDGLRAMGVNAIGALREPSLGPLFGRKGGAIGGGLARIEPSDKINMHFTGDIHAVTAAHNLLAAIVDNHVFQKAAPVFAEVTWGRALDMNDRALRTVDVGFAAKSVRRTRFDITAASEVMAVLCMSSSVEDLRARLDRIVVGRGEDQKPITAKDLGASGAMAAVLLEAVRPNLVSTLYGSPVLVHGGPFANVAQGTSTLIQTQLARALGDVVVTEAGFAFDLGGVKFCELKCRVGGFKPAAVVLVCTVRALRFHGGNEDFGKVDVAAVERGLENISAHVEAMSRLGLPPPILCINRFPDDDAQELEKIRARAKKLGVEAVDGEYFGKGAPGAEALARAVKGALDKEPLDSPGYRSPMKEGAPFEERVSDLARTALGAREVVFTDQAKAELSAIRTMGFDHLPPCLAKTHLSISDDEKVKGRPPAFTLTVTSVRLSAGAGFLVVLCGPILTMPGLPKVPAAARIDIERDEKGAWRVVGIR